jgi:hypothetical protein
MFLFLSLSPEFVRLQTVTFPFIDKMAPLCVRLCERFKLEGVIAKDTLLVDALGYLYEIIKPSIFMHFCAGETLQEATLSLRAMKQERGLDTILFYSTENANADSAFYDSVCSSRCCLITHEIVEAIFFLFSSSFFFSVALC